MTSIRERIRAILPRDRHSGFSHWVGAFLAVAAMVLLIIAAKGRPYHVTTFAVYGATLVLLFLSSALYHSLRVSPRIQNALFGLDRAAIYALIAGTYTPICLIALRGGWGWSIFGVVWGLAAVGIAIDLISRQRTPHWLQGILYLITGWVALVAIVPLVRALPPDALGWLLAGSLIYTLGAVVCIRYPQSHPTRFCPHAAWHWMVIAASGCHFALIYGFIARM